MTVYYSTTQVAEKLNVSQQWVNRLCREKKLGVRIGRNWAISESQLKRYLARRQGAVKP